MKTCIRCPGCLSIGFVVGAFDAAWTCGVCGTPLESMGIVEEDKLKSTKSVCPCDKRCTRARGPICVCRCACENHGTGRMVEVVTYSGVPKVMFEAPEVALARFQEYAAGRLDCLRAGVAFAEIQKMDKARQHKRRMRMVINALMGAWQREYPVSEESHV